MSSFVGAIAVADLVKTTLGPKGMDKILQSVCPSNVHGHWIYCVFSLDLYELTFIRAVSNERNLQTIIH